MNCTKDFRFDFLGALKCLCNCDDRLRNELEQVLEEKVCTIQASNNGRLFSVKLIVCLQRTIYRALSSLSNSDVAIYNELNLDFFSCFSELVFPGEAKSTSEVGRACFNSGFGSLSSKTLQANTT